MCCRINQEMTLAKIVCVLYDDPVTGYPTTYARDDLPHLERYPDGQTLPTPRRIDFQPGTLLGSVSGELGLRKYLRPTATSSWSPRARTARTACSTASCTTPRS